MSEPRICFKHWETFGFTKRSCTYALCSSRKDTNNYVEQCSCLAAIGTGLILVYCHDGSPSLGSHRRGRLSNGVHRSIRLRPWRTCEQAQVSLSNAILHNSVARVKHTCTHVGPYSVGLLGCAMGCDWSIPVGRGSMDRSIPNHARNTGLITSL